MQQLGVILLMAVEAHSVDFPEILNKPVAETVDFVGQMVAGCMELFVVGSFGVRHLRMAADHIPEVAKSFVEDNSAVAAVGRVVVVNRLVAGVVGSLGEALERNLD